MSDNSQNSAPAYSQSPTLSDSSSESSENTESSGENLEVTASEPIPQATQKEIKKELKKLKLKVDGREEDVEFDPSDDEFLTKELQKARAFGKRSQEYSDLEKTVRSFVEELRKNPRKVLADPNLGVDLKNLAKEIIEEEIENSQKSPEQLKSEKMEAELKAIKEEREKEKKDSQQKEFERLQQQEYERYEMLVDKALSKSDLPASPYIVGKMADYMLIGLQEGLDVQPEDVIPLIRDEMQHDLKQMFAVMPDEVIEQLVGKDVLTRLRKKNLSKAKQVAQTTQQASKAPDVGQTSKNEAKDDKTEKKTIKQLWGI